MEAKQSEPTQGKKISRRKFLELAGIGGAALVLKPLLDATADIWQPKVVELGIDALENPAVLESVLGNSAVSLEALALSDYRVEGAPKIEINSSYKPMVEIIGEVLDKRRSEGKPITYQRVTGYESLPYYLDKLQKVASDPANRKISQGGSNNGYVLGYNPNILFKLMYGTDFLPERVHEIWQMSGSFLNSSLDLIVKGSGFLDQTIKSLGEGSESLLDEYSQRTNYWQEHQGEIDQIARTCLQNTRQHVETIVIQTGTPISAGEIFSYRMDTNNGSVNKSIMDTTIFLKYMARNDITLLTLNGIRDNPEKARANEDWFKENIKDEYGKVGNYSQLPHQTYPYHGLLSVKPGVADLEVDKDLHLLNQIGRYHPWNIATLLTALPPAIAQIGVMWEQYTHFIEHGPAKTASDFRGSLELGKLDSLFMECS